MNLPLCLVVSSLESATAQGRLLPSGTPPPPWVLSEVSFLTVRLTATEWIIIVPNLCSPPPSQHLIRFTCRDLYTRCKSFSHVM